MGVLGSRRFRSNGAAASWVAALVIWSACPAALAQNNDEMKGSEHSAGAPGEEISPWRFEFAPYFWLMGVEGDIGARGTTVNVGESFLDIVDASDTIVALSARFEAGYRRFGVFLDGFYADITIENQTGPEGLADVDVEFKQTILDFGAMYRVGDWEPSGDAAQNRLNITLDAYAGGRYSDLDIDIRPAVEPPRSGSKSWVDPIVGAKLVLPFAEQWHAAVNGDIGGFGVASDFTWSATALVGFDFHVFGLPSSVLAGYRAVGWDYSDGEGSEKFTWDVIEHGLVLGFSMRF